MGRLRLDLFELEASSINTACPLQLLLLLHGSLLDDILLIIVWGASSLLQRPFSWPAWSACQAGEVF